jgi:chromosome segregation protein
MYLARIELYGFKSFAQRTVVDFSSGVTSVVGPNGCGKTNILDAVRWVLGEQRTSTLRSDRMESVIFNGSRHRRPLGLAEVSLTIENSRGILPLEYSEVLITRRLYRSGESEYLLNRVPCRLKDITDLFMDTGMGAGSYSVIELKMVEDLLSERPEERRHLFEEAAGVTKYKHRRRAALRKLDETRQNIERLEDVVTEAGRQMTTLKRQVRKTQRHREYVSEQKTLDLQLARAQFLSLHDALKPLTGQVQESGERIKKLALELEALDAKDAVFLRELVHAEQRQTDVEEALRERAGRLRKLEEEALVGRERLLALQRDLDRMSREKMELQPQLQSSQEKLKILDQNLAESSQKQERLDADFAKARSAASTAQSVLDEEGAAVEKARAKILDLLGRVSRKESAQASVGSSLEEQELQRQDRQDAQSRARDEQAARLIRIESVQTEKQEKDALCAQADTVLAACEATKESVQAEGEECGRRLQVCLSEEKALQDRHTFLDRLLSRFEGVPGGARQVLEAKLPGVIDTLGNLLHAEKGVLAAVEVALGDASSFVLVKNRQAMQAAVEVLEEKSGGGCTFLLMDELPSQPDIVSPFEAARPLVESLRVSDQFSSVMRFLLRDFFLVDSLENLPEGLPRGSTYLTADGQLFRPPMTHRRGRASEQAGAHLGLSFQLEESEGELEILSKKIDDARHAQKVTLAKRQTCELALKESHERRLAKMAERDEVSARAQRLHFELERFQSDEASFLKRDLLAKERKDKDTLTQLELQEAIQTLKLDRDRLEEDLRQRSARLEGLNASTRVALDAQTAADMQAREWRLRLQADRAEQARLRQFLEEGYARLQRDDELTQKGQTQAAALSARGDELERDQLVAREARLKEEGRLEQMRSEIKAVSQQQKVLHREQNEMRQERETLIESQHAAEIKQTELLAQTKALVERMRAEYDVGITLPDASDHESLRNLDQPSDQERILEIKEALRRLGPVNLLAIEEYDSEKERFDFLQTQLKDLLEAEKMLKEMITRINRVAGELFEVSFQKIRTNFEYLFKKLFNDGHADLSLTGEDQLEGEIAISASPSGKRIQSLSLMSGGEKTLTAIALLFAIYMVKPSPFCILDEVDAPLDDANIGRFNTIIQEFSAMTQFIIITHNKKTMGYADQLYGVTMAEEGVSSLVSVQFND